ncbi:MAG: Hsp70 family protein [Ramlibacter sp.]|nr:Hsp70 family protein [Ramlibacter sp.]
MRGGSHPALGIDFGTSNSAVSFIGPDGMARLVPLEEAATALPTAVFFNSEDRSTHFGRDAIALYMAGVEGRLMRSLKSLLGSRLLEDETAIGDGVLSFRAIIARFLGELRGRAARHLDHEPRRVVIGRPVHFVDDDPERDRHAQSALAQAATTAGFSEVSFELEPIAAALDYERRIARTDRSDDILATAGVHIGGTDYDQKLNLEQVMPLLGFRHLGASGREVPSPAFLDLSSWHLIHWMYTPRMLRQVRKLRSSFADTRLHDRLMAVLEGRLAHLIASEVESAKIDSSVHDRSALIDLAPVEPGLGAMLDTRDMARHLEQLLERVVQCALGCVSVAGLKTGGLDAIYLTGGSSSMRPFQALLRQRFPTVAIVEGDLFGGVASGLAYAGQRV